MSIAAPVFRLVGDTKSGIKICLSREGKGDNEAGDHDVGLR
jgi:hypothetical protein